MQNALFDDLKNLKKDLALNEKKANEVKQTQHIQKKEAKLKVDFEAFMQSSGIKKLS
ncbi:MAG: hypothetical protein IBX44_01360 [Sulfurospirillum sp.]|nr:hypothetical protein [Sulfurospirillum sp.]